MFDIHLAWSPIGYLGASLILLAYTLFAWVNPVLRVGKYFKVYVPLIMLIVLQLAAWDVGTRQSDLGRSNFNAAPPVHIEKVEVERLTRDKVRVEFEATIDENHKEVE